MAEVNSRNFEVTISSEGVAGPAGPVGPIGPQGPKGDPGGWEDSSIISAATDLNNLIVPGSYFRTSSTGTLMTLNYPMDNWAGMIEVFAPTGANQVIQRATALYSTIVASPVTRNVWYRARIAGAWQPWAQVPVNITGLGSPEGVHSAPVGTKYLDAAATNGAVEWIKASGVGNTGWKVVYGDTGWRNLSVPENFVMTTVVPTYQIRRTAEGVYFRARVVPNGPMIGNAKTATFAALDIPIGFLPDFKGYLPQGIVMFSSYMGLLHTTASRGTLHGIFSPASGATGTWAGTESIYMNAQWDTDSQWPTTLPGTAV